MLHGNWISMLPSKINGGKYRKTFFAPVRWLHVAQINLKVGRAWDQSKHLVKSFWRFSAWLKHVCHRSVPFKARQMRGMETLTDFAFQLHKAVGFEAENAFSLKAQCNRGFKSFKNWQKKKNTTNIHTQEVFIYLCHPKNELTILRLCSKGCLKFVGLIGWEKMDAMEKLGCSCP